MNKAVNDVAKLFAQMVEDNDTLKAELAAAQAAHAKSHEEAADWRRLHTELLTELSPWRQMARQLEALIEAGWMPIHWQWEYPGN